MRNRMWWMKPVIIIGFVFCVGYIFVDMYDTQVHNCKATGEQRLANGVDGVVVENKLVCDGGRVKWSMH